MKRTAIRRTPMKRGRSRSWNSTLNARAPKTEARYVLRRALEGLPDYCEAAAEGAPDVSPTQRCYGPLTKNEILTRARGGSITDRANIRIVCASHNEQISQKVETMRWAHANGFLKHAWEARGIVTTEATGERLYHSWTDHPHARACPRCAGDVLRIGIQRLAYVFEGCECELASYPHLVQRLWHLECLIEGSPMLAERELLDDAADTLRRYKRGQTLAERIDKVLEAGTLAKVSDEGVSQ